MYGLHGEFLYHVKTRKRGPEPKNFYVENDVPHSGHVVVKEELAVAGSFLPLRGLRDQNRS